MLVSLSLEVIDNILIQLSDSRDVCNVRLVCKALAELGLRHLAPRVTLVRLPKAFDRLLAIANHPVISYHVVEVIYYVDGVPEPPKHRGPGFEHLSRRRKSFTDWQTAHSEFIRHEQEADESILLLQAFQRFPRLTSLKISNLRDYVCEPAVNSYERHPYSHWPASEFGAGKYSLLAPAQDETVSYGSKLVNLLGAACITSLELRQLSLDRLEPEALSDYTSTVKHEVMKDMFGSLHKLRLILTHSLDTDNPRETWQRVGLQDLIWSSPYLDHLEIAVRNHCGELNQQLSFQFMFEGRHWRQLSALHLEEFETKPELLTEFLRAHASSLNTLGLSNITLLATDLQSWVTVFQDMASNLCLCHAEIGGYLHAQRSGGLYEEPHDYRKSWDEVYGLGETFLFGTVLSELLYSPYFKRPQNPKKYSGSTGEKQYEHCSHDEIVARDQLFLHLFDPAECSRLIPVTTGKITVPSEFAPTYRAARGMLHEPPR